MSLLDLVRSLSLSGPERARTFLTLLGIAIGTGSIVLLASILGGGEAFLVQANQEASNGDVVEVHVDEPPPDQAARLTYPLSRRDAEAIARSERARSPDALVEPESSRERIATFADRQMRVTVVSAGPSTLGIYRLGIAKGRALDDVDRLRGAQVCVIGDEVYEALTRRAATLDDLRLTIDGHLFVVVGVLARKPMLGSTDSSNIWDRKVMIPETTYDALNAPSHEVKRIFVRKARDRVVARAALRALLLRRHLGVANFAIDKDESGGMESLILTVIHVLLVGTGVLALVASGINIMNVMLVTVTERTREIGLRRAIGATPRDIRAQFVLEAAALSLVGALGGIGAGGAIAWLAAVGARAAVGSWSFVLPGWSLGLGIGLAVVTGVVFGWLPASRAARIAPVDALRAD